MYLGKGVMAQQAYIMAWVTSDLERRDHACAGLLQQTELAVSGLLPDDITLDLFSDLDPLDLDPFDAISAGTS